jgi:ferredoxin-like protein FixX
MYKYNIVHLYNLSTRKMGPKRSFFAVLSVSLAVDMKVPGGPERPCITLCPAGVYEAIRDEIKPANPSNCLHCKTCQRKCPFDNIRWTAPEGAGGPRYKRM